VKLQTSWLLLTDLKLEPKPKAGGMEDQRACGHEMLCGYAFEVTRFGYQLRARNLSPLQTKGFHAFSSL